MIFPSFCFSVSLFYFLILLFLFFFIHLLQASQNRILLIDNMNADIFHCLLLISGFECPVYGIVFFHQGLTALHIFQIFHTIAIHLFPDIADDLYQSLVMGTSIDHFMYLYIRCRKHPQIGCKGT